MKEPREICPRCGRAGSGIYWKSVGSKGRTYKYAYFAHHNSPKQLKWCYLGSTGFIKSRAVLSKVIDSSLSALLRSYVTHLRAHFQDDLVSVAVFGSVARGAAKFPESDIDIMAVVKGLEGRSLGERMRLVSRIEADLSKGPEHREFVSIHGKPTFQAHVLTPSEVRKHPPILLDMVTDGIILYDDDFLAQELQRLEARLKELGAEKRRLADGSWYWRLKRNVEWGEVMEI